jgi:hypothetical protein
MHQTIHKSVDQQWFCGYSTKSIYTLIEEDDMQQIDILKQCRDRLRQDIVAHLDVFLIGTVAKSPSMSGHGLTTKVKGKTVSLYVRKGIVRQAQEMTKRYTRLWLLLQKLSRVNWEILKSERE